MSYWIPVVTELTIVVVALMLIKRFRVSVKTFSSDQDGKENPLQHEVKRALGTQYKAAMLIFGVSTVVSTAVVVWVLISAFNDGNLLSFLAAGAGIALASTITYSARRFYEQSRKDYFSNV